MIEGIPAVWRAALGSLTADRIAEINSAELVGRILERTDSYDTPQANLDDIIANLTQAYRLGTLTLVLGAGVSLEYGIPDWNTLLQQLQFGAVNEEPSGENGVSLARLYARLFPVSPLIAARQLAIKQFPGIEPLAMEEAVRKAVYENHKDVKSLLVEQICQLCASPGHSEPLEAVITYNYDDVIESHLDALPLTVPYRSIYSEGVVPGKRELPIYHVHGFLPRLGDLSADNQITLSESSYHQQYDGGFSWSNLIQIEKFRSSNCLFVGLSLADPNMRRLLDLARRLSGGGEQQQRHWCIRRAHSTKNISRSLEAMVSDEHPGVEAGADIDVLARSLQRMVKNNETDDLRSFGIEPIWVDEYSDIPGLLEKVSRAE